MGKRIGRTMRFDVYLPRGPHDAAARAQWIERVLRAGWEHGATYTLASRVGESGGAPPTELHIPATTWEQTLEQPAHALSQITAGREDSFSLEDEPLRTCIARMAGVRSSSIELKVPGGFYLSFDFAIDPALSAEEAALLAHRFHRYSVNPYVDRIQLSTDERQLGPGRIDEPDLMPIQWRYLDVVYLDAYEAFWRWAARLCELTRPLFGLGYHEDQLTHKGYEEQDLYYRTGGQELLERRLPDLDDLFETPPARYLAPDFPAEVVRAVSERTVGEMAPLPGGVARRLRTGGTLVVPGDPFFTPEAEQAFGSLRMAARASEQFAQLAEQWIPQGTFDEMEPYARAVTAAQREALRPFVEVMRTNERRASDLLRRAGMSDNEVGGYVASALKKAGVYLGLLDMDELDVTK